MFDSFRSRQAYDVAQYLIQHGVSFQVEQHEAVFTDKKTKQECIETLDFSLPNYWSIWCGALDTPEQRRKVHCMVSQLYESAYGHVGVMLERDGYISRSSRTLYSDWAKQRGIHLAIGNAVPRYWYEGAELKMVANGTVLPRGRCGQRPVLH